MHTYDQDPYRANPTGRDARLAGYAPLVRHKPPRLSRAERHELVDLLSGYDILNACDRDDLAALVSAGHAYSVPAGWAMVAEGTPADFCYVITRGTAAVYKHGRQVAELGEGSLVGEMAVLTGSLRSGTVTTRTRVSGVAIDNEALLKMFKRRSSLYRAMREQFVRRAAAAGRTLQPLPLPA